MKICKKHASINYLTCSAPWVNPFILKNCQKRWGVQKNPFVKVKKWSLSIHVMIKKNHLKSNIFAYGNVHIYPPFLIPSTLAVRNFSENCSASFENLQYTIFMQKIQRILKALSEKKWILTTNYGSDPVGPFLTKD